MPLSIAQKRCLGFFPQKQDYFQLMHIYHTRHKSRNLQLTSQHLFPLNLSIHIKLQALWFICRFVLKGPPKEVLLESGKFLERDYGSLHQWHKLRILTVLKQDLLGLLSFSRYAYFRMCLKRDTFCLLGKTLFFFFLAKNNSSLIWGRFSYCGVVCL